MVACKGSVVVAWRRGGLRAGLVGVLAALAMVGAVGGLWFVAGDRAGHDAAGQADPVATPDRSDADGQVVGGRGAGPGDLTHSAWSHRRAGVGAGGRLAGAGSGDSGSAVSVGGAGTGASPGGRSAPAKAVPDRGGSPSPSTPATTTTASSDPSAGATTTTTAADPPSDDGSGAGGPGGLLGGVLDILGLG